MNEFSVVRVSYLYYQCKEGLYADLFDGLYYARALKKNIDF